MIAAEVILRPGRDRSARNRHPWIYAGAIGRVEGEPSDGALVTVKDADGAFIARGVVNQHSQIAVRLLGWDIEESIDDDFFRRRIERAVAARDVLAREPGLDAYRLVHAEADGLPGLVVDRYGDFLSVQFLAAAAESHRVLLLDLLEEAVRPRGIVDRSDEAMRRLEGLPPTPGIARGVEPPAELEIHEGGCRFVVDLRAGQKTGYYLDQRRNRRRAARMMQGAADLLDTFCYTGSFSVHAARAGVRRLTLVDTSASALGLARTNLELNDLEGTEVEAVEGSAFDVLRGFRDARRSFDAIVLDPPKFAQGKAQLDGALRAYKDINLLAMKLLRPGGRMATFSCSGVVTPELFQKVLFQASADAGRDARVIERLDQGRDHPVLLTFPESHYLKGALLQVD